MLFNRLHDAIAAAHQGEAAWGRAMIRVADDQAVWGHSYGRCGDGPAAEYRALPHRSCKLLVVVVLVSVCVGGLMTACKG